MQEKIKAKCEEIKNLLVEKNESYGNAVFDKGVLFNVDPLYAIQARINDKLNRIRNNKSYLSDNDLMDLTGYLILLQVMMDDVNPIRRDWKDVIIEDHPDSNPFSYEWNETKTDEGKEV